MKPATGTLTDDVAADEWAEVPVGEVAWPAETLTAWTVFVGLPNRRARDLGRRDWERAPTQNYQIIAFSIADPRDRFVRLLLQWRTETAMLSSIQQKVMHPAYQRIIGMGPAAVPMILDDLRESGGHWYWALTSITEEDPAEGTEHSHDARASWLEWGRRAGYLADEAPRGLVTKPNL